MGEAPEEGGDQDVGSTGERRVGEGQLELWHCAKRAYLRKVMQHGVPVGTKPHFKGPSSAAATAAAAAARPQQQSKTMNQGTLQIHHRLIFASTDRQPKCQQSLDSFRRRVYLICIKASSCAATLRSLRTTCRERLLYVDGIVPPSDARFCASAQG